MSRSLPARYAAGLGAARFNVSQGQMPGHGAKQRQQSANGAAVAAAAAAATAGGPTTGEAAAASARAKRAADAAGVAKARCHAPRLPT